MPAAAQEYTARFLDRYVEVLVERGVFRGHPAARRLLEAMVPSVSRHDVVPSGLRGMEWHPRLDLLRARQGHSLDDDGQLLARVLGWRPDRVRKALGDLRDLGLVDWDGTPRQIRHIRLRVKEGVQVDREAVVYDFQTKRPVRRRRTVPVRAQ